MSDNQVGAICAAVVFVALFALVAFRLWLDHKERMEGEAK